MSLALSPKINLGTTASFGKVCILELPNFLNNLDEINFEFCESVQEAEKKLLEELILRSLLRRALHPCGTLVLTI